MMLLELVDETKKNRHKIIREFQILESFQRKNPWHVLSVLKQMGEEGISNVPSFDDVVSMKEEYILDNLGKVFTQIKKHNPLLLTKDETEKVYFYVIKNNLYANQLKKGFALGDKDNKGRLVTGSDLVIEIASINIKEFLESYYIQNN